MHVGMKIRFFVTIISLGVVLFSDSGFAALLRQDFDGLRPRGPPGNAFTRVGRHNDPRDALQRMTERPARVDSTRPLAARWAGFWHHFSMMF